MIAPLALLAAVIGFLIWLLIYCLRVGAVGSYGGDATRSKQPIRFWTGIVGLGVAVATMVCLFVYLVCDTFA